MRRGRRCHAGGRYSEASAWATAAYCDHLAKRAARPRAELDGCRDRPAAACRRDLGLSLGLQPELLAGGCLLGGQVTSPIEGASHP